MHMRVRGGRGGGARLVDADNARKCTIYTYTHVHEVDSYTRAHTHVYMYTYIYTCIYVYIYIHICMHICVMHLEYIDR